MASLHISEQKAVLVTTVTAEVDGIEDMIRDAFDQGVKVADEAILRITDLSARVAIREDLIKRAQHTADGLPLGPTVKEQKTITEDTVETVNLTVVKKADRSGVILRQDKVELDGTGQTLAQTFTYLAAQDANSLAAVAAEQTARTTAVEAEAASRLALQSVVNGNKAAADQGIATLTTQTQAISTAVTQLNADFQGNKSSVAQTLTSLANADAAEALARTQLASTVGNNKALADQSIATLANADSTEAILREQLAVLVGQNKAAFDDAVIVLGDADKLEALNRTRLETKVDLNKAYVDQLSGTVATVDGKVSSFVGFELGAGKKVVGWRAANDGTTGVIDFNFDAYILRKPDGTTLLQASGNTVTMPNVVVDTFRASSIVTDHLVDNSVTVPTTVTAADTLYGGGYTQTIASFQIYLNKPGMITAQGAVSQHFPNGIDKSWDLQLYIDDTLVYRAYGARAQDSVPLLGGKYCGAGTRSIYINWYAVSGVNLDYRTLTAVGIMK